MSLTITLLKHFWPARWLAAIEQEAHTAPAIVTGIVFIWLTLATGGVLYWRDAEASKVWRVSMEQVVSNNTKALQCSSRERAIGAKVREIERVLRLVVVTADETDLRQLQNEQQQLERELANMEKQYDKHCINGGVSS